jgi:hypothetical protein
MSFVSFVVQYQRYLCVLRVSAVKILWLRLRCTGLKTPPIPMRRKPRPTDARPAHPPSSHRGNPAVRERASKLENSAIHLQVSVGRAKIILMVVAVLPMHRAAR